MSSRNTNSQRKYRDNSKSKYKPEKECCHKVGVEVMKVAEKHTRGRKNSKILNEHLNGNQNYRMCLRETNQGLHKQCDKMIINSLDTGERQYVTQEQAKRIKQIQMANLDNRTGVGKTLDKSFDNFYDLNNHKVINRTRKEHRYNYSPRTRNQRSTSNYESNDYMAFLYQPSYQSSYNYSQIDDECSLM
ncbi:hypothetical protein M0812_29748 [Anaeramoeba flamelloides]|uniref:Uncharacterized protein n=1 Tax=Anaeramoeba flamelloides TaxID=1746091 RepID=A0AAV7Y526_9EUKA|nr:hypothetical protein M0812_29748 [Anaeramoeba flamelloides]